MTIQEIKEAIDRGDKVFWGNHGYRVTKDSIPQYLIHCLINDTYVGLTNRDGTKLNGNEEDFFIDNEIKLAEIVEKINESWSINYDRSPYQYS